MIPIVLARIDNDPGYLRIVAGPVFIGTVLLSYDRGLYSAIADSAPTDDGSMIEVTTMGSDRRQTIDEAIRQLVANMGARPRQKGDIDTSLALTIGARS